MAGKTVTIGVRVSEDIKDALAKIAKEERRTLSQVAAFMIEAGLEQRAKPKSGKPVKPQA